MRRILLIIKKKSNILLSNNNFELISRQRKSWLKEANSRNSAPPENKNACNSCGIDDSKISYYTQKCRNITLRTCKPCMKEKSIKVSKEKVCYVCHVDLEESSMLSYTRKLSCGEEHEMLLCSYCIGMLKNFKRFGCLVCDIDWEKLCSNPRLKPCLLCLKLTKGNMSVGPLACDSLKKHKFAICTDCVMELESPGLICRYCAVKGGGYYGFQQPLRNFVFNSGVLCLKIVCHNLTQQRLFADPENADFVSRFTLRPFLFESDLSLDNPQHDYGAHFRPGAATFCRKDTQLVTGGLDPVKMTSSNECLLVRYSLKDRVSNFTVMPSSPLTSKRHGHVSFFSENSGKGWVFGGVSTLKPKRSTFLSSIESFKLDPEDYPFEDELTMISWSRENKFNLSHGRADMTSYVEDHIMYLFGGSKGIGESDNSIDRLDLLAKTSSLLTTRIPDEFGPHVTPLRLSPHRVLLLSGDGQNLEVDLASDQIISKNSYQIYGLENWSEKFKLQQAIVKNKTLIFGGKIFYKDERRKKDYNDGFKVGVLDIENKEIRFEDVLGGIKDLDMDIVENSLANVFQGEMFSFRGGSAEK